ncbi:efflux RND transporter periplasmic adaptor subunit [Aquamicrobium sp. LC103]|uniref:efflux RND transporter periplasmic adaptor subunit n=1 Tax=Aquamicrobium sp. LC103 TaxID=1120658 RepID=UPI00063E90E2|nr:efflux RND transporter periplasmic adaptor subunit [Aquamicrobium sp. LC103]TKT75463.1 efflux RND transporter periplasmic adaptor subunit [Aquamicrobium sp. LC103]
MSKFKFHKIAAIGVFLATAAWVATGEFSSVGSAADETAKPAEKEQQAAPARTVAVVTPPRVTHSRAIRISGHTEADKRATLATRAPGIVAERPVDQGDRVEAGDLIIKLDAEEKEAAVDTARQLLAQRQAEADAAERLAKSGNLAKLQLDNTRSALSSAKSQLEAALAELGRIEVRAPFDGVVDRIDVQIGGSVQAGTQVATILKLDPVLAIGEVSERDLRYIKPGDKADVRLVNGQEIEGGGVVRYISRDATTATRTFRVEIAIPNDDLAVPAGMTTEITLRADPVDSVILPRSVVSLSNNGDLGIRAVSADNKVMFYPIDLVDDTPKGLVLAGIPESARIIVAGQELVSDGDTVQAVEADKEELEELAGKPANGTQ